jgi:transcriptional regulator with XRE-family HTH domain
MNTRQKRGYNLRYELIKARHKEGLTQRQVAELIFCSPQSISQAERGKLYLNDDSEASKAFFMALENLYGIPREILRKRGR